MDDFLKFETLQMSCLNGTFLCKRHPVVLQEDDLQLVSHHGVIIHHISHRSDQPDDHLRHVIPRSGLQRATVDRLTVKLKYFTTVGAVYWTSSVAERLPFPR